MNLWDQQLPGCVSAKSSPTLLSFFLFFLNFFLTSAGTRERGGLAEQACSPTAAVKLQEEAIFDINPASFKGIQLFYLVR